MAESMKGMKRTHYCGEVLGTLVGNTVTVGGWVQRQRRGCRHGGDPHVLDGLYRLYGQCEEGGGHGEYVQKTVLVCVVHWACCSLCHRCARWADEFPFP